MYRSRIAEKAYAVCAAEGLFYMYSSRTAEKAYVYLQF